MESFNTKSLITEWVDYYNEIIYEREDQRVKDWFLMGSPIKIISVILMFLYVVKVGGPKYMKDRQPYNLKKILAVYNVIQIFANAYIFYAVLTSGWSDEYTLGCQPVNYSYEPKAYRMATLFWYGLMLKIFDYLDTLFFVLRKKDKQVSFLHVYHHVITVITAWIGCKWLAGGMASFSAFPNTLVHILMYTYYLLALCGPRMQERISSFKKAITILQMVQFWVILIHSMQALAPSCPLPNIVAYFYMSNIFFFFYLFYDFYKVAYKPKVHTN